jgi:hypothetical protein
MTFAVVEVGNGNEKVVGTIWASAESEAQSIVSDFIQTPEQQRLIVRRAEERELPMKPFN